jgi:hypothetical protein
MPVQVAVQLASTHVSAKHYDISGEGGALLQSKQGNNF